MNDKKLTKEISDCNSSDIPLDILISEFAVMGCIKLIFLIFAINNFIYYSRLGYNNRKINKWSDSFCIKMLISMLISINYSTMAIVLQKCFCSYSYLWFLNSVIWIIAVSLLYFEYRRKLPQSWIGLRLFWLLNGIFYYGKITYTISYYNTSDTYDMYEYIVLSLIQSFFSTFLLYYSIFKARDYEFKNILVEDINQTKNQLDIEDGSYKRFDSLNRNEIQIARYDEQGNIQVSGTSNIKSVYNRPPLIILSISEIKFRRFSKKGDSLITISKDENILENAKLRLALTVNLFVYKNKKPSNRKNDKRNFVVKKSLREIINFNLEILNVIELRINVVSPLHIQLKSITEILRNFTYSKFKGRDLTSSDFDRSILNDKKETESNYKNKIKNLETIYVNLCRNFGFFVPEFFKFLEINDEYLIGTISKILEKYNSDFDYSNKEGGLNKLISGTIETKSQNDFKNSKISKKSITKNKDNYSEDFYSEIDLHNETDEYICKTMAYINSILTHENYFTLVVTDLKEKRNLIDSIIVAILHIKKTNLKTHSIEINISFKNLLEFVNKQKYQSYAKIKELKGLISDPRELLKIKLKNNNFKFLLGGVFTRILNDLFYLNEEAFQIFELNKILNCETNNIDDLIISSFFDLNNRNKYLNLAANKLCAIDRNIFNYKFSMEFDRLERVETSDSNSFLVLCIKMMAIDVIHSIGSKVNSQLEISTYTDYNHCWMVDISLNELHNVIFDLISILNGMNKYCELLDLLKKTINLIEKIVKTFITENSYTCHHSRENSCRSDSVNVERISSYKSSSSNEKLKIKPTKQINELVDILNKLFVSPNIYVLYSDDIRSIFNINFIFDRELIKEEEGMEYDRSDHAMSNSNKSILENLLD